MMRRHRSGLVVASVLLPLNLFLVGCGGNDSGGAPADGGTPPPSEPTGQAVLGPLAGAAVEVYALSHLDGAPVHVTTTSSGAQLNQIGLFTVPAEVLDDQELYVVKVSGGEDFDADDDGVLDPQPTASRGTIHAVLTAQQIRRGGFHVSILTEVIYRRLVYLLAADYPVQTLLAELNRRAGVVLRADVDGDGDQDGDDIAAWDPAADAAALRHGLGAYRPLIAEVHGGSPMEAEALALTDRFVGVAARVAFSCGPDAGLEIFGNTLYVVDRQLYIIDVRDPAHPVVRSTLSAGGECGRVAVVGSTAYVALVGDVDRVTGLRTFTGLSVVDVSDPGNPVLLGRVAIDGVSDVAVVGDTALVATSQGLQTVDVTDPANPVLLGLANIGTTGVIRVDGDLAYLNQFFSLRVLDISDPRNPVSLGSIDTGLESGIDDLAVSGTVAYALTRDGFRLIDVSDPANPAPLGTFPISGVRNTLSVPPSSGMAYVATNASVVRIIDVRNPREPRLVGTVPVPRGPAGMPRFIVRIVAQGSLAYVAGDLGLQVVVVSDPGSAAVVGALDLPGVPQEVAVESGTAYVAADSAGLQILDVSSPVAPALVGHFDLPGESVTANEAASDVQVSGALVYVADRVRGLGIIDVTDPAAPALTGFLPPSSVPPPPIGPSKVRVTGSLVYGAFSRRLAVADVSDPTNPTILGALPDYLCSDLDVLDGVAYCAATHELKVASVADPAHPTALASLPTPDKVNTFNASIKVAGPVAYVGEDGGSSIPADTAPPWGLQIIDISNPASPAPLAFLPVLSAGPLVPDAVGDLELAGSLLYLASGHAGVQLVDVSNPGVPRLLGAADVSRDASGLAVDGGQVYVVSASGGLEILRAITRRVP